MLAQRLLLLLLPQGEKKSGLLLTRVDRRETKVSDELISSLVVDSTSSGCEIVQESSIDVVSTFEERYS